jgi:2-amino-4-hydroxy-6-hydroxymethyldihydropteridine diphosphokinase
MTAQSDSFQDGAYPSLGASSLVALGLGTNVGDRLYNLLNAIRLLQDRVLLGSEPAVSSVYETKALVPDGAPQSWDTPYLNLALRGRTDLPPQTLLNEVKAIEIELGRNPSERWAPRVIDIDILLYEDQTITSSLLNVPHKEISMRPFVAVPLAEVWPEYVLESHGVHLTVEELASTMVDDSCLLQCYSLFGRRPGTTVKASGLIPVSPVAEASIL